MDEPRTVKQASLIAICEELEVDPKDVERIVITPTEVTVTHRLLERDGVLQSATIVLPVYEKQAWTRR